MDLDTFLVSLYVLVDDWWRAARPQTARKSGRPPQLTEPEVLTLAVVADRFCGTMREMAGTDTFDEQGEVVRFPRVFVSRESFYHWYEDSYHLLKMDWETWFSTDITREMNLLQGYLYTLHTDITNAPPDVFPAIGVLVREDFIDFSANLERSLGNTFHAIS